MAVMKNGVTLCLFMCAFGCSGQFLKFGGYVFNVFSYGLKILNFASDVNTHPIERISIVHKLQERISTSTEDIKTSIGLSSKLGIIDDAVIDIHSSLFDIKDVLESNTTEERDIYSSLFVKRYEDNDLIKYIRFLPELLTYNIPGASGKLIDLLADNTRCNMTALDVFRTFYVNLLSDGIAIDLLYLHLSTKLSLNKTISEWNASLEKIATIFDNKQTLCKKKFPELAQEDVDNAVDAVKLWSDNKQRYNWKTSDVMFLRPFGTYQLLYLKSRQNCLFWQKTSARKKIAVFNDISKPNISSEVLVNVSETLRSSIEDEWDENAAQHVGQFVERLLIRQGLALNAIVVFFDGGDFSSEKIKIDDESSAIQLSIEGVKLSHCYENVVRCSWFKETKEVSGKMRIFAYVTKNVDSQWGKQTYTTGSFKQNQPVSVVVYFMMLVSFRLML